MMDLCRDSHRNTIIWDIAQNDSISPYYCIISNRNWSQQASARIYFHIIFYYRNARP